MKTRRIVLAAMVVFLENGTSQYELSIDEKAGLVSLYSLNAYEVLPREMEVTLIQPPYSGYSVKLAAVTPLYEPYAKYVGSLSGGLSLRAESVFGLQLKIGFGEAPRELRKAS